MSKTVIDNTNFAVKSGFTSMLALVLIFGLYSLYQLKNITFDMTNAIESNSKKIVHVILMRDAIRQRQSMMTEMLLMEDVFEREKHRLKFFKLSAVFREERKALLMLPINESEKKLLDIILVEVRLAQSFNREAVNYLVEDFASEKTRSLILSAQASQKTTHGLLGDLIKLQNENIQQFVKENREQYSKTLSLSILFGIVIALLAWLIARIMARFITDKNSELEHVTQQALEATRTKSKFLATMSHEIRTPLTSIIGFAEALSQEAMDIKDKATMTKNIIKNGKHLLKITNDILDISKIEANRMEFENAYFSPVELITDVEETVKKQFMEKGIQFYIEYVFPLPNAICNDELRIKQIILNLCSNALKFTKAGKVSIKVHCDIGSEKIYFTVIDSGIGLTKEQIDKIFDAFSQADSSTTRKYGGTGLGLSLSKKFAEQMGGTIIVESLFNIGSQFCVSIDTGTIDSQQLITVKPDLPNKIDTIKYHFDYSHSVRGDILIAEDNPDNQQLLSILLSDIGAKLTFVENGRMAIDEALNERYDLIFMDMQMPVMGGLEATKKLRDANYKKPIVALTANAMKSDYDMCIEAGCDGFITKPINKEKLFQTIYKYLEIDNRSKDDSIIDFKKFEKRSVKMQALTKIFVEGLPSRMQKIEKSRLDGNWKDMKVELHKIKGVGSSMGYPMLTDTAAELEYEVIRENEVEMDKLLLKMKDVCKKVENTIP